ncbi:MAG: hypothetical protein KF715_01960 [Candidatus Didemnitutus sp.]|nr:hypothetical protein [Candidatus Didemnitutus sp.]
MPSPSAAALRARRGSALIVVIFFIFMLALLTGSVLRYTVSERRSNERQRLVLRARNMAENVALYGSEQITTKLYKIRNLSTRRFSDIYLPPDSVLTTDFSAPADSETYAGLTSTVDLHPVTDTSDPNFGLQVASGNVDIIAKSAMSHTAVGGVTAYARQQLSVTEIPLFQFAIFYNKDLEVSPGANMTISGPVHSNGNFISRSQSGFANTIRFTDRVTAKGGFFANTGYKGTIYNESDTADTGPGGSGALYFQNPAGSATNIYSGSIWRDHFYSSNSGSSSSTPTASQLANFKSFATSSYGGNFRTSVHGVTELVLPGIDNTATDNGGRYIVEPAATSDTAGMVQNKFSRRAGLYIIVNPDDEARTGTLPDATTVSMRARSYRCWLNTVNTDGSHTLTEVVLPGQPSYGANNATVNLLPNAYRTDTSVGSNQVLRIPKARPATIGAPDPSNPVDLADTGYADSSAPTYSSNTYTFQDAFFYDLRRATNSNGHPFSRSTNPFAPRPISKIDFDMTRFKMAVDRTLNGATTSTVFNPARPNSTNWSTSIFNSAASSAALGLGTGSLFNNFSSTNSVDVVQRSQSTAYAPSSILIGSTKQTGVSGTPAAYSGRFVIATTTSTPSSAGGLEGAAWTNVESSSTDESAHSFTPPAGITGIRVSHYLAGGTTVLLDQQIIPVTIDRAGAGANIFSLSNDRVIVPSTSNTGGFLFTNAYTDLHVYVDGVEDTPNWTFTFTVTGSSVGGFGSTSSSVLSKGVYGNGDGFNRFWLTGISTTAGTTTGTVVFTAAKGTTTLTRTFTWVKQSSIAGLSPSNDQSAYWLSASDTVTADPFKIYYADSTPTAVPGSALFVAGSNTPWFDGITVYVHSVDAESTAGKVQTAGVPSRLDSGVRLINGRGPVASITTSGYTGLSFTTNDALYIVGHFNADGTINSNSNSNTNPGGYSGRYPESSSEYLTAVMGDAITILSQPEFTQSGSGNAATPYVYTQTSGWCDALSGNTRSDQTSSAPYSTSWQTSNPSSSNSMDGTNQSVALPPTPFQGTSTSGASTTTRDYKFEASETEVSACLLTGIVETTTHQHSGGVHNYPRLLEQWSSGGTQIGLYIRGSMVAMFASEVATEPWSIRIYTGAGRFWGLHESLRDEHHDVPLEPILLNAQRLHYTELTSSEYESLKTTITGLH